MSLDGQQLQFPPSVVNNDTVPVAERASDGIALMKHEPQSEAAAKEYKDVWASVLFACNVIAITAIGFALGWSHLQDTDSADTTSSENDDSSGDDAFEKGRKHILLASFIVLGAASGLCYLWIRAIIRNTATFFIHGSILFSAAACVVAAVVMMFVVPVLGFVCLVFAAIMLRYYCFALGRISFASANLATACKAVEQNAATVGVAFAAFIPQIIWCLVWMLALVAATAGSDDEEENIMVMINGNEYEESECQQTEDDECVGGGSNEGVECDPQHCVCDNDEFGRDMMDGACPEGTVSSSPLVDLYVFLLLVSFYWGAVVIKNVVHVTTAGAVATWWFRQDSRSAVWPSFKRSGTTSFGSICFGSLFMAICDALREAVEQAGDSDGSGVCLCVAMCVMGCVEDILEYFNHYAFIYVGIYGLDFVSAGKAVCRLFKDRGWTTIINDDLIGRVLLLGAIFVAATTGLVAYGLSLAFDMSSGYQVGLIVLGSLGGFVLCLTVVGVIHSAVGTVFVCFAEDPLALRATHPDEFKTLMAAWQKFNPSAFDGDSD